MQQMPGRDVYLDGLLDEMDWSEREWNAACGVWEQASVRDRMDYCKRAGVSIFAARRAELPQDDNGSLRDYSLFF